MECKACGVWFVSDDKSGVCHTCKQTLKNMGLDLQYDRLRELAQADRDGRCVVVPVKLGQPVYCLQDYFNDATMKSEKRVKCRLVDFIPVASKMFETNGLIYQFSEIGKTVFLTREEAEAALKERKKDEF